MRGQDDGLCTVVDCIFDGGDGASYSLGVGDLLFRVQRDIEIDLGGESVGCQVQLGLNICSHPDEDTLVLEIKVADAEFVGERHGE